MEKREWTGGKNEHRVAMVKSLQGNIGGIEVRQMCPPCFRLETPRGWAVWRVTLMLWSCRKAMLGMGYTLAWRGSLESVFLLTSWKPFKSV